MRPCATPHLTVRHAVFGGPKPLICVPLVATTVDELLQQAAVAHALAPDVVEWRADAFNDLSPAAVIDAAGQLRNVLTSEALIFTLRISTEGGVKPLPQDQRREVIDAVVRSGDADIIDLELSNGADFVAPLVTLAHLQNVRVILSFHDFAKTPDNDTLTAAVAEMVRQGADIAKVACTPVDATDVLRMLDVTLAARRAFPATPLCTLSMGRLGVLTRVAGFLFGSDMSFAVGQAASAPGQIPVAEMRTMIDALIARS